MIGKIKEVYIWIAIILLFSIALIFSYVYNINGIIVLLLTILLVMGLIFIVRDNTLIILSTMFIGFMKEYFTYNLRFPTKTAYLLDILVIILIFKILLAVLKRRNKNNIEIIFLLGFTLIALLSLLVNNMGIKRFINSFYFDYFRYFIIYIAIIKLDIKREQIKVILNAFICFMILQLPVILYQTKYIKVYETAHYVIQDYYSGLLGGKATAEIGFLILILISYFYGKVINKNMLMVKFLLWVLYFLIIIFISEIKVVVLLIPITIILINIIYMKDIRGIIIIAALLFISYISMDYLSQLYPKFGDLFNSKENILQNADYQYAGSGISRLNGIPTAIDTIDDGIYSSMLGKGPGYGVKTYNGNYQFRIFYFPYIISEYGLCGFSILIIFFLKHLITSIRLSRNKNEFDSSIGIMGIGVIIVIMFSGIYSMSMVKSNFAVAVWMFLGIIIRIRDISKVELKESQEGNQ